jgi:hypothetical protein
MATVTALDPALGDGLGMDVLSPPPLPTPPPPPETLVAPFRADAGVAEGFEAVVPGAFADGLKLTTAAELPCPKDPIELAETNKFIEEKVPPTEGGDVSALVPRPDAVGLGEVSEVTGASDAVGATDVAGPDEIGDVTWSVSVGAGLVANRMDGIV